MFTEIFSRITAYKEANRRHLLFHMQEEHPGQVWSWKPLPFDIVGILWIVDTHCLFAMFVGLKFFVFSSSVRSRNVTVRMSAQKDGLSQHLLRFKNTHVDWYWCDDVCLGSRLAIVLGGGMYWGQSEGDWWELADVWCKTFLPIFLWAPPQMKHITAPPGCPYFPLDLRFFTSPKPPSFCVVSWSKRCVYFVRLRLPKFLTCMTLGSIETSTVDSVASV